ncbi:MULTISPECIES: chemotaxis protein CheC [Halorussus]|uniref:chemotaxis protein CheC n=1 Tax=Halorussus TaxID=1070314 RepID=UPI000E21821B|nr:MULTISPECIES: chemotaxis protein CheC [Halorussus]NHN57948.1 chemotaxis protein CheC [Halorussus sp. JP-T4]
MKLDVDTLGTFYEMAREGAGLAASRLSSMTDIPARVEVTHLNFTRDDSVARELADAEWVGIRVGLSDGVGGTSLLLFDRESAETIASAVVADVPTVEEGTLRESTVTEIAQIMNNGFVDGWANVLDTNVDVSAPTYVTADDPDAFLGNAEFALAGAGTGGDGDTVAAETAETGERSGTPASDDLAVLFRNNLEAVGEELTFRHYLIPDAETVRRLFRARTEDRAIEFEKLVGFDRIAQRGATQVAANLTQMTDIEMDVDIRRINFISLDAIPSEVSTERMIGVAFSFSGMPSGYLLFLFDEGSARRLVSRSVEGRTATDFGAFERDAVQELSNVMASGMLDGWANLLDTTIDHSTPAYAHDMGAAVVDPLVVGLGESQEFAFVFDTRIEAVDTEVDLDIYVIPDEADLRTALGEFDMARVADTEPEADTDLSGEEMDLDYWDSL